MEKQISVSIEALKTINALQSALDKSPTGVSLISIKGYTNRFGEVSNNLVNAGAKLSSAKAKDVETLKALDITKIDSDIDKVTLEKARVELLNSFTNPNQKRSQGQIDAYTKINECIKVHNETGEIYIFGLRLNKTIITKGEYKKVNSRPLTIAKRRLEKELKSSAFTNFKLSNMAKIRTNGEELIFEV